MGFTPSDCIAVEGDGVCLPLRWKGGAMPSQLANEALEMRLRIENATVFSYSIG